MLQQTTVQAVIPYFLSFIERWPTVQDLASADNDDVMSAWAGLGYYARARNLLKCARAIAKSPYNGHFPDNVQDLEKLPGIGPYTAAAICAIAFNKEANVVDGNVERVISRVFAIQTPLPESKKIIRNKAAILTGGYSNRPGDYAQAIMDLGATICVPSTPKCKICPVNQHCKGYAKDIANDLPKKSRKQKIPTRKGQVFWISNQKGQILIEKRDDNQMLGGMTGLPGSTWDIKQTPAKLPTALDTYLSGLVPYKTHKKAVRHTFSHFHLALDIVEIGNADMQAPAGYSWAEPKNITNLGFPTLFKKVVNFVQA